MILVFGTVCIDRVRRVPYIPGPGGYVEVEEEFDFLGGEAANTATALRHWGVDCELWGNSLGTGDGAKTLSNLLAAKGLENKVAATSVNPSTPICDVLVTPEGDRTMLGSGFATMGAGVDPDKLPYTRGGWFVAEPNMRKETERAAQLAAAAGMHLYLMDFIDPNHVPRGSFWQSSTDWAGTRNNTQKNVAWVEGWVATTGAFTILSDGPNGFVAGSPDSPARTYPPYPAPEVVDTTGAGDMFRAGMVYGLSQGWPIPKCLQFASAAGCLKCRALGATTDVPTVAEILALIESHPAVSRQYS